MKKNSYRVIYGTRGVDAEHYHFYDNMSEHEVYNNINNLLLGERTRFNYAFVYVLGVAGWTYINSVTC